MEYGNLINLSQSTIAKNLNLAKSNVSYYFKNLKKKNILVEKDGHVFMNSNIFSKGLAHRLDEEKRKNLKSAQVEDDNFKNSF